GGRPAGQAADVDATEGHRPGGRPDEAGEGAQQRRLPRPVRTDERDEPAGLDGEVDAAKDRARAIARGEGPRDERGHATSRRRARTRSRRKDGAPSSPVRKPSGRYSGATAARAPRFAR